MTDTSFIFRDVIQYKLQKLFCQMNSIHDKRRKKEKGSRKILNMQNCVGDFWLTKKIFQRKKLKKLKLKKDI